MPVVGQKYTTRDRIVDSYWNARWHVRHPVWAYNRYKSLLSRPKVGEWVEDCRYQWHQVVKRRDDDLILDDGSVCSWSMCTGGKKLKEKP